MYIYIYIYIYTYIHPCSSHTNCTPVPCPATGMPGMQHRRMDWRTAWCRVHPTHPCFSTQPRP